MATIDDQAATWIALRSERELSEDEQYQFNSWYEADIRHKGAYLRAAAIDNALNRIRIAPGFRPVVLTTAPSPARPRWRMLAACAAIAASVAVTISMLLVPANDPTMQFMTAKGQMQAFTLADKSVASLNSDTEVDVKLTATARQIRLKHGEAWFQVAKDKHKPFIVEAGMIRVRAVGTAFSVHRQAQGVEILVTEGVVEVWSDLGDGRRVLVSQGEQAFVSGATTDIEARRQPAEVARRLAWRNGKIMFTNQTLEEAVKDFNRYSLRRIVIADPSIRHVTFVGQYAVDAPETFAKDVSAYLDVPLSITAGTITIGKAKLDGAAIRNSAKG